MCIPPQSVSPEQAEPTSAPRLPWILLCIPIILFWSASPGQQSLVYSFKVYLQSKYLWTCEYSETPLDTSMHSYHIILVCISRVTISTHVGTLTPPKTLKCVFL